MLKTLNVSILDAPAEVIGHCCNCFHTMGSGVAHAIREKYPEAYVADCKKTIKGDIKKLGRASIAKVFKPDNEIKWVANLYGQYTFGTDKKQVSYEAIYEALTRVRQWMNDNKLKTIAFPYKMCCALAGGDWRILEAIITVVFEGSEIEVLICNYEG